MLQAKSPQIIIIDEPDLGLHPSTLQILAALNRSASIQSQIILSTQSVSQLNLFKPEDILVVNRHNGETTLKRIAPDDLLDWLTDYSLDELWEMNILGGETLLLTATSEHFYTATDKWV